MIVIIWILTTTLSLLGFFAGLVWRDVVIDRREWHRVRIANATVAVSFVVLAVCMLLALG